MIKMYEISDFITKTLSEDDEFKNYYMTMIDDEFVYFRDIDKCRVDIPVNSFMVRTFNDEDDKGVSKEFKTSWLINIPRSDVEIVGNIVTEQATRDVEDIAHKAVDIFAEELRMFGVNGNTNILISYVNIYLPVFTGEDEVQIEVDIVLEQGKYVVPCNK